MIKQLLAFIIMILLQIRKFFYKIELFKKHSFDVPVVSIGNIEFGGSGKTPFTIFFSNQLNKLKIKHVIISRGYKKQVSGLHVVSDTKKILINNAVVCGDEPLLIAEKCPNVPVVVCETKVRAINYSINLFSPQLILLDDGFQSFYIHKDLDIVLINSSRPANSFRLFPLGFLREPSSALSRADVLVFTKQNEEDNSFVLFKKYLQSTYSKLFVETSFTHCLFQYKSSQLVKSNIVLPLSDPAILFAGLADTDSFFRLGRKYCDSVHDTIKLQDHVGYHLSSNFKKILQTKQKNTFVLITTMKDFIKLRGLLADEYHFLLTNFKALYIIDINYVYSNNSCIPSDLIMKLFHKTNSALS